MKNNRKTFLGFHYVLGFVLLLCVSCTKKGDQIEKINDFIYKSNIDTSKYNTLPEIAKLKQLKKFNLTNNNGNTYFNDSIKINEKTKTIFLRVNCSIPEKEKHIKLDFDGNIKDSIVFNTENLIYRGFIFNEFEYCTWFRDGDKSMKRIKKIVCNDSTDLKEMFSKITKNYEVFGAESVSGPYKERTIDFVIAINQNEIIKIESKFKLFDFYYYQKYNYKEEYEINGLKSTSTTTIKQDDFFVVEMITGSSNRAIFSTNIYPVYKGTRFLTIPNLNLKIKMKDTSLDTHVGMGTNRSFDFDYYSSQDMKVAFLAYNQNPYILYMIMK